MVFIISNYVDLLWDFSKGEFQFNFFESQEKYLSEMFPLSLGASSDMSFAPLAYCISFHGPLLEEEGVCMPLDSFGVGGTSEVAAGLGLQPAQD